jgi:tetratricopeptide (TPR) repeat protein
VPFHPVRRSALAALAALALGAAADVACSPRDPLERVRQMQDVDHKLAESLDPMRELLEQRPEDPEVNYRYGVALLASGQHSLAKWSLRKAMDSPEWAERAGIPLANTALQLGNYDEAVEVATRVLEKHPDRVDALVLRAEAYVRTRRQYEQALADANRALELDPENRGAMVSKVVSLLGLGRADEAAPALDTLESSQSDESLGLLGSPALCAAQATFAKEKGDLEEAEKRFERCIEQFPSEGLVLRESMAFFDAIGKHDRSEAILRAALAAQPESFDYRAALIERLRATDRTEEAEKLLHEATELQSPTAAAVGWSAVALDAIEKGKYDEAAKAFARAKEIDPTQSKEIVFGYADALVVAGRYDEALALAEQITVPAHRELVLGRVALARGEPARALEHFTEANRLWPNNAVARYYAAAAAEQIGDFDRAVEDYRYSMRIDVRATDAYLRLARLQAAAGQLDLAMASLDFQPGGRPHDEEAALMLLELAAKANRPPPPAVIGRVQQKDRAAAAAALARGFAARLGPAAALDFLRNQDDIDLTDPGNSEALAITVDLLAQTGKTKDAVARVERALAKHADAAAFHAIHGDALAANGAGAAAVRAAYQRALELDPAQHRALVGLAALEAKSGARDEALALYERAVRADANDRASVLAAAELLVAKNESDQAEARLTGLLRDHPYDAKAAMRLAELRLARGADAAATKELARRAVKFGGGEPAQALLDRIDGAPAPAASAPPPAQAG